MKALNINSKPKIISLVLSFVFIIFSLCPITAYAEESETESQAIDVMLQKSQQWLNNNYSEFTGFELIPEDGISRRSTLNGCIKALQVDIDKLSPIVQELEKRYIELRKKYKLRVYE